VNDAAQMRSLVEWGVDGLITDDPQLFLDVLKEAHLQPLTR
jgi:glycerophosphoryl diester phosphodiesterase